MIPLRIIVGFITLDACRPVLESVQSMYFASNQMSVDARLKLHREMCMYMYIANCDWFGDT